MTRVTTKLTTALAGLALAGLPAIAGAQSTTSQQPRPESSQQQRQEPQKTSDQNSPQHHLDHAKKVLNDINPSSMQGEARTQVTELKRNFNQLENAWRNKSGSARPESGHAAGHTGTPSGTAGTTGSTTSEQTGTTSGTTNQTPRSERASGMAGNDDWMRHYHAIDSTLKRLIGDASASSAVQGSATGATSGTTTGTASGTAAGTAGTTGRTDAGASAKVEIDASLRSQLTEFRRHLDRFHAAAMSQNQRMGEEDRVSADPHSGVTGSMTGTSGTSGEATTRSQSRTSARAPGQVDSAAIARLTASIDALLRGSSAEAAGTSGTSSAAATGTSGTASAQGTVCVDRGKLEELKREIQALNRNQQ